MLGAGCPAVPLIPAHSQALTQGRDRLVSCGSFQAGKGPALGVSFMVHTGILASQSVFTAHRNGAKEEDASMAIQEWGCSYVLLTPPPGSFPQPLSDAQRPQMLSIVGNTQEKIL